MNPTPAEERTMQRTMRTGALRAAARLVAALGLLALGGCASPGEQGTLPVDCGEHGSEHDGHCHCDPGYLLSGETCVAAEEITEVCAEPGAAEEEHGHEACLCPASGACPCAEGTVQAIGARSYCVPELHHEG